MQNCEKAFDSSTCQSYVCNWPVSDLIGKSLSDIDNDHLTASSRCYMTYDSVDPVPEQTSKTPGIVPRGLIFRGTPKDHAMESFKVPFEQCEWQSDKQNKAIKRRMLPCKNEKELDPRPEVYVCQTRPQRTAAVEKELHNLHQIGKSSSPSAHAILISDESSLLGMNGNIAIADTRIQKPPNVKECVLSRLDSRSRSTPELRKLYNQTKIKKGLYRRQLHTEFEDALNVNHNPVYMFNNCSKVKMNNV